MHKSKKIDDCFKGGDYEKLKELAGNTANFPDCEISRSFGHCLEYAIYHSPIPMIKKLLRNGADPNYKDHAGFPSIIAALSTDRGDIKEIITLLVKHGVDINQHGHNDWTPLHWAAAHNNVDMIKHLLKLGADPNIKTRIDDYATPSEEARTLGCINAANYLEEYLSKENE